LTLIFFSFVCFTEEEEEKQQEKNKANKIDLKKKVEIHFYSIKINNFICPL
jgi:hypothetical protein